MKYKEEVISSLDVESYLENYLNDENNCLQAKIEMSSFLIEYIDKSLYAVQVIKGGRLYVRVENADDEILSREFFLGTEIISEAKHSLIDEFEFDTNIINENMMNIAKEYDKFLFQNLDKIKHKYVGYKIKPVIPTIDNTIANGYSIKCSNEYKFIGFDNFKEIKYWLDEGYSIYENSDLEKIRGLI